MIQTEKPAEPPDHFGWETPHHGYHGDRGDRPPDAVGVPVPASLTLAISREAGSRGASIARRVAQHLGWQVYDHELLNHIAHESSFLDGLLESLPAAARAWAVRQFELFQEQQAPGEDHSLIGLVRAMFALGAQGEVVIVGRGAGFLLPRESTLHARIVAPLPDRIAYLSQWLRLSVGEAADQVRVREQHRAEFLSTCLPRVKDEPHSYDLILNSGTLGEELTANLITQAVRARVACRGGRDADPAA